MIENDADRRALVPSIVGFAALLGSAAIAIWLSMQQEAVTSSVRHTLEIENRLSRVQQLATDAETAQRGFLLAGRDPYLTPYNAAVRQLTPELDALAAQTIDNPNQQASMVKLRRAVGAKLAELETTLALRRAGRTDEALAVVRNDSGQRLMVRLRDIVSDMHAEEERLLNEHSERAKWVTRLAQGALVACALLVVLLAILTLRDVRRRQADLQGSNRRLTREMAERAAAEGQVRQLQKMEAVGQLTGGIAHDFNNMLAVVIGSLDLARRRLNGTEDPRVPRCIENAAEGAERAAVLTARLLAFSRRQPLDPKVVDANQLVAGMSRLLRRLIGETMQIETVRAGGLWLTFADSAQLESAIVNLAVNARDAMPEGGKLTIDTANCELDDRYARAHQEVTAGQYVMIAVTDTGIGMPPDVIERAFEPFYTTKGIGKGTGLGLSQVFGFVKQSRGHVKIYSEVGRGSTVKIYLPRMTGAMAVEARVSRRETTALPVGVAEQIVLVVEDEEEVRRAVVGLLGELGYTAIDAATPEVLATS